MPTKKSKTTAAKPAAPKDKRKKRDHAQGKPKRVSALDAAAQVLAKSDKPMRAQELIAAMTERGLWKSPNGKTPHATLFSAMMREVMVKGKNARFKKVDRGMFEYHTPAA